MNWKRWLNMIALFLEMNFHSVWCGPLQLGGQPEVWDNWPPAVYYGMIYRTTALWNPTRAQEATNAKGKQGFVVK